MPTKVKSGAELIAEERERQVNVKGYVPGHDDEHTHGEIALAAICYAAPERVYVSRPFATGWAFEDPWPWPASCDRRPHNGNVPTVAPDGSEERVRLLAKAGAMIAAEIDRQRRLQARRPRS